MNSRRSLRRLISIVCVLWLVVGCSVPAFAPTAVPLGPGMTPAAVILPAPTATPSTPAILLEATPAPSPVVILPTATTMAFQTIASTPLLTVEPRADGLSDEQATTLSSLEQVDDHPLYTMRYYGPYGERAATAAGVIQWTTAHSPGPGLAASPPAWACSLFAALGNGDNMLYGRNFDWEYSPALLLFTNPPDGYASVSMVDIAYFGFGGARAQGLTDLPLSERRALLNAPYLPFDGMNEHGLAVGMAAVPPGQMQPDPGKETIGSLMAIRMMLDQASNVDEAAVILENHNIVMGGGPPIHYLIADPSGRALLVEFYQGEMVVIPNETPWHQATNFLRSSVGDSAEGQCWRYDSISRRLMESEGHMTALEAVDLLAEVAQGSTQWSIVYGMSSGEVNVVMGREYDKQRTFRPSSPPE